MDKNCKDCLHNKVCTKKEREYYDGELEYFYCNDFLSNGIMLHAKWDNNDHDYFHTYNDWFCSNCHYVPETRNKNKLGVYCAACGARMFL